jgi:hypothetical protein
MQAAHTYRFRWTAFGTSVSDLRILVAAVLTAWGLTACGGGSGSLKWGGNMQAFNFKRQMCAIALLTSDEAPGS